MDTSRPWTRRRFAGAGLAGAAALAMPGTALAGGKWELVTREGGVTVTTRRDKGRQFPSFRGTARVKCDPWDIVAVVHDATRHHEWAHQCSESKILKEIDATTAILYSRTNIPWPAKDRDVVLRGTVEVISPDSELRVRFNTVKTKLKPELENVVRIPVLDGHWYLVKMGEHTLAEYQVNADPGGALPQWLVEQGSRDIPLLTIKSLRKQLKKTMASGEYGDWIAKARAFKQGNAAKATG